MTKTLTLTGIRVIDFGRRASSAWCSRLLADYGAEVMCAEAESGHPIRQHPPFSNGESIPARYFLANKRFGRIEDVAALIPKAHVIVTDTLPERELDYRQLAELNPTALVCAITPYGQSGARSRFAGTDLTVAALSGWASVNGLSAREPLKASGYQVSYQAGTFAFGCILAALLEQLANDSAGQLLDIAELEVCVSTFAPAPLRYQYSGYIWPRKLPRDVNDGPVPVADGFFALTISRPMFWVKAMRLLGLEDLAEDKTLQQAGLRPKHKDRFADRLSAAMSSWTRMELFDALAAQRVIAGPVLQMDDLSENPQFLAREFFRRSPSGKRYPGPFAVMSRSDWRLDREMRKPRSDDPEFLTTGTPTVTPIRARAPGVGPLAGFRGVVLTQAWAGTYATELLALNGAEVIQLEVRGRLDSWRGTYQNPIPKLLGERAEHAWNCSPLYNSVNLNKKCITLDLSTAEGVVLFKSLVAQADFVADNFSPRVMGNFGLDYAQLKAIKPDIVMASLSAYGASGPWANVPGIGGTIEPSSGMSALLGYVDGDPLNSGQMYPDPVAGLCGFAAIALALLHRDRTGEGQYIDLSMQEANFTFIGDAWLEYEMNAEVRGPAGNSHPCFAPHGIFAALGDDQWLAIAVESDRQWVALCELLEIDGGAYETSPERKSAEAEIGELLQAQTAAWDKLELAQKLCELGIPAAAVLNAGEVAEDAALRERGHMVVVDHPEAGKMWQSGLAVEYSRTPAGVRLAAPLQGEHSFAVFNQLLGMDRAEYERLVALEVTGQGPTTGTSVEQQA